MAFGRDSKPLSWKTTALWLVAILVLALALRVAFNVDSSYDAGSDTEPARYLYSGNDPYYHHRTTEYIVTEGESLTFDPAINYPHGGNNPNPPVFDWSSAMFAGVLVKAGWDTATATSLALNTLAGLWGALAVIPVFMIGADLFGRRAGIWGAFFMAVSAPHIGRGIFGFADHDATTMFFIVLAMAFLVKGLKALDHREYVADWRNSEHRTRGIKEAFTHNKEAMIWSALAGVALSATALTWKGYPYVLAIMAIAVFFQLLLDHGRNRDSTAVFAFYVLPLVLVTLLPLIYYSQFPGFMSTTITPGLYVLLGVLIAGLVLVPTRDLPSIVVFPALALAGILGLLVLYFFLPAIWSTIFTGLGYFQQTKLYSTIAEAQRTDLGKIAASFGFFTFLIAFWIFGSSIRKAWKGDEAHLLMAAWSVVALFMAFAAERFVSNASPVFAILAGAGTAILVSKLGWGEVRKRFRQQHGQNKVAAGARSLTWKASLGVLGVALLIVLPNFWLGVDAATPPEVDRDLSEQWAGAFGTPFGIKSNGWLSAFDQLAAHDTELAMEDRPAFIAWWDYGHWATAIGEHPTVADPFQNHYNVAGRFLASESEHEAMSWLVLLILDGDYNDNVRAGNPGYSSNVQSVAEAHAPGLFDGSRIGIHDGSYEKLQAALGDGDIFSMYEDVTDTKGKTIGYLGVDRRMFPIDVQNSGIFYAPVYLANKNPDEFLKVTYRGQAIVLEQHSYDVDENGDSYRLDQVKYINPRDNSEWEVYGQQAFPKGQSGSAAGISVSPQLQPTERFDNSMYSRAYGGFLASQESGDGLTHWRLLHQSTSNGDQVRDVAILAYYKGVEVSGRVLDQTGAAVAAAEVTFEDGTGARHAVATTDANGEFTVLAPFAVDNDLTLQVLMDGELAASLNDTSIQFSLEQARMGDSVDGVELTVPNVDLVGTVYEDVDGDGMYTPANDTVIVGAIVEADGRTVSTGGNGTYRFTDMQPGKVDMSINATGYDSQPRSATLLPSRAVSTQDFALVPSAAPVTVTLMEGGQPVAQVPVQFVGDAPAPGATSGPDGVATAMVRPGEYTLKVQHEFVDGNGQTVRYDHEEPLTVSFGGAPVEVTVELTRQSGPAPS